MEIWLDTADLELIKNAKQMGVLHGVTTNPSIIAKSQLEPEDLIGKLLLIQNGPVTVQVTANRSAEMIRQGEVVSRFSNRIIIKVPVTREGLKAIHGLASQKIPTMATAVFDVNQVLLAARAGAAYIAPYFSTICEADQDGLEQFKAMFRLIDRYKFTSKLIAASLKSNEHVRQCAEMGAHAVTLKEDVFLAFIEDHPETLKRMDRFSKDWTAAKKQKCLGL
jgi:transaldolase